MLSWELVGGHVTRVVLFSVSLNHALVGSLCFVRVFKLFSRSIHYISFPIFLKLKDKSFFPYKSH